jgi:G3E family GTPase
MVNRIPICLITGFLGAGKTTLLRQILKRHTARRLVFLVNEFAATDVDGALVSAETPDVVMIPGGSIFCKCLVSEFIRHLRDLPGRFGRPDGVVIEASGMANPTVVETMLRETRLDATYVLTDILAVVDPGSFLKLIHTLPAITAQVQSADVVLINKVDRFAEEQVNATKDAVRQIKAGVNVLTCSYGQAPLSLFERVGASRNLEGGYAPCRDPQYESREIHVQRTDLDLDWLVRECEAARDDLYRLKGHVRSGGRCYYVDGSQSGVTVRPVEGAPPCVLAAIVRPACSERTTLLLRHLSVE